MKQRIVALMLTAIVCAILPTACKKTLTTVVEKPVDTSRALGNVPLPKEPTHECIYTPSYGDTTIYPQPLNSDYYVYPSQHPQGTFMAWPEGLVIDTSTGAINVNKSETGQKYIVGFVATGTKDTCTTSITLGGATYMDSVYIIQNNATNAAPYYDADPKAAPVCDDGDPSTANDHCEFDISSITGAGLPTAKKIRFNKKTGVIDLKKSLQEGVFGVIPFNGATVNASVNYRLKNESHLALQQVAIRLIFYNRKSEVPASILNRIQELNSKASQGQPLVAPDISSSPRPPLIVVTRFN